MVDVVVYCVVVGVGVLAERWLVRFNQVESAAFDFWNWAGRNDDGRFAGSFIGMSFS
jgi:hypothetical protein